MLVRKDAQLTITIPSAPRSRQISLGDERNDEVDGAAYDDVFTVEYSQPLLPDSKKTQISLTVDGAAATNSGLAGGPFTINNEHDRSWVTMFGAVISKSGAWWHAKDAAGQTTTWRARPNFMDEAAYETARIAHVNSQGISWFAGTSSG